MAMQFNASGLEFEVINVSLSSTVDAPVMFKNQVSNVSISCQTTPEVDLQLRRLANDKAFWLIPAGIIMTIDSKISNTAPAFFLRAASGNPIVQCIGFSSLE